MKPYEVTWWDDLACNICNWVLKTFATEDYRRFVTVVYRLGVAELDRRLYAEVNTEREEQHPWTLSRP